MHPQVVFNCIDYGEYFDTAVMSLCVCLGVPYITASSYGHTAIAECYPPGDLPGSGPCWVCNNAPAKKDVIEAVTPDKVAQLETVEFLPQVHVLLYTICQFATLYSMSCMSWLQDVYMPSNQEVGSSVLSCTLAATLTVGAWLNALHGYTTPHWTSCDFAMFQLFSYRSESNNQCPICQKAPR